MALLSRHWVNINSVSFKNTLRNFLWFLIKTKIFFFCLVNPYTLKLPWVTKTEFLLTISIQYKICMIDNKENYKFDLGVKGLTPKFWLFIPPLSKLVTRNLVLDQDKNFYLMSLNFLITCLLDKVWRWQEEVTC